MARNQEKAQSMLFRFREASMIEAGIMPRKERPKHTEGTFRIDHCRHYRREVVREIGEKLVKIQDVGLDEYQIRELNDQINRLLKEKNTWENRIRDLGGFFKPYEPDPSESAVVPGDKNYRYFGRAKELPGVKELLESSAAAIKEEADSKSKFELLKGIDIQYFGFHDEDDNNLVEIEKQVELQGLKETLDAMRKNPPSNITKSHWKDLEPILSRQLAEYPGSGVKDSEEELMKLKGRFPIPNQEKVSEHLLELRKEILLRRYT